ncbi:MAG TPA: GTPase RsgA, partial [Acidimicrobiales bacterium]|nr:GTPase RsgA [Acidimicrobiales bacterium]
VDLRLVLRLLALVSLSDLPADIVVTKIDEALDLATDIERIVGIAPDVRVHQTSARTGAGVDAFHSTMSAGGTYALMGESGSGKSTLLNALMKEDLQRTGEMAHRGGGRQTTTAARLVTLPSGAFIIDTAGFSDHAVVPLEALVDVFPAITALAASCGFRDCRHDSEPNCAVLASVAAGETPTFLLELYRGLASDAGAGPKRGRR